MRHGRKNLVRLELRRPAHARGRRLMRGGFVACLAASGPTVLDSNQPLQASNGTGASLPSIGTADCRSRASSTTLTARRSRSAAAGSCCVTAPRRSRWSCWSGVIASWASNRMGSASERSGIDGRGPALLPSSRRRALAHDRDPSAAGHRARRAGPPVGWPHSQRTVEYPDTTGWLGIRARPARRDPAGRPSVASELATVLCARRGHAPWRPIAGEAARRFRELFSIAVAKRYFRRCGVLLSGGLDSSAVAVVAARDGSSNPPDPQSPGAAAGRRDPLRPGSRDRDGIPLDDGRDRTGRLESSR